MQVTRFSLMWQDTHFNYKFQLLPFSIFLFIASSSYISIKPSPRTLSTSFIPRPSLLPIIITTLLTLKANFWDFLNFKASSISGMQKCIYQTYICKRAFKYISISISVLIFTRNGYDTLTIFNLLVFLMLCKKCGWSPGKLIKRHG